MLAGTDVTEILNLRGLKCPLPALKTRKTLRTLTPGVEILVECTDPMAVIDIPHMVRETGDLLLDTKRTEDAVIFRIRRA
jgi:tRNA 2-thiouridine synthesizing protein A